MNQITAVSIVLLVAALPTGIRSAHAQRADGPAAAQEAPALLTAAEIALDNLRYDEARQLLEQALRAGGLERLQLARTYLLSGLVAGAFGDPNAAREQYTRALALDPTVTLPGGLSPKIVRPFTDARRDWGQRRQLSAQCTKGNAPGKVVLTVSGDSLRLVDRALARYRDGQGTAQSVFLAGRTRFELTVSDTPSGTVELIALDRHSNRLTDPCRVAPPGPAEAFDPGNVDFERFAGSKSTYGRRPLYARWWLWAGATGAVASVGAYYGIRARGTARELDDIAANSEEHDYADAKAIERRGRREARIANVSFAAATGVAVVGAALWFFTEKRAPKESEPAGAIARSLSVEPRPGGATIGVHTSF
jgi:hypothetical protein